MLRACPRVIRLGQGNSLLSLAVSAYCHIIGIYKYLSSYNLTGYILNDSFNDLKDFQYLFISNVSAYWHTFYWLQL